jgi:hypothetical protein
MLNKESMDFGDLVTKKATELVTSLLNKNVSKRPVFILKDGRKVSLNPKLMKVKEEANCE